MEKYFTLIEIFKDRIEIHQGVNKYTYSENIKIDIPTSSNNTNVYCCIYNEYGDLIWCSPSWCTTIKNNKYYER